MAADRIDASVELIDLADVCDDESWVTDEADVESFCRSIRRGMQLPPITLRRIWHDDASWHYEIIDGFHRFRALVAEGMATHLATVIECDMRTAEYDRAQASLNKERSLLNQRAIQAIRQGFVRDMAAVLDGVTLYEPVMDDAGIVRVVPRQHPLPSDPLMALGALYDHLAAKQDASLDWEGRIVAWLDEMCARFGKSREWLRDEVLGITALVNDGVAGKNTAERAHLLAGISDVDIRRMVLGKLKREPKLTDTRLRFALDWLGCGPDCGTLPWLPSLGRAAMQSRLVANTLDALCTHYLNAAEDARQAEKRRATTPPPELQSPVVPTPAPEPPVECAEPFTVVSSSFVPASPSPTALRPTIAPTTPPTTRAVPLHVAHEPAAPTTAPVTADWTAAHLAIVDLLRLMEVYDKRGGDWSRADVRRDLQMFAERARSYLARV